MGFGEPRSDQCHQRCRAFARDNRAKCLGDALRCEIAGGVPAHAVGNNPEPGIRRHQQTVFVDGATTACIGRLTRFKAKQRRIVQTMHCDRIRQRRLCRLRIVFVSARHAILTPMPVGTSIPEAPSSRKTRVGVRKQHVCPACVRQSPCATLQSSHQMS